MASLVGRIVTFDEEQGTLIHRVDGSSHPNWKGRELIRYLEIKDKDHIIVRTPPTVYAGKEVIGLLSWRRRPESTP